MRLAKAQLSLVGVANDMLRVHGELADIGREMGSYDLRECPSFTTAGASPLVAVA